MLAGLQSRVPRDLNRRLAGRASGFAWPAAKSPLQPCGLSPPAKTRMPPTRHTPLQGYTNIGQFFCYNCRPMNKGLIYPDECYAIRGAIYEVHNEMGSGFKEEL